MIAERGLPVNLDVERFVLGSCMLNGVLFAEAAAALEIEDFSLERHQIIFRHMRAIAARGGAIDVVTICEEIEKFGEREVCGGWGYVGSLNDGLPEIPNLDDYIRIVRDKSLLRKIIFTCQKITSRCILAEESAEEIIESMSRSATLLSNGTNDSKKPISTREMIETEGIERLLGPRDWGSVKLNVWPELNRALHGFHGGQVILLMAATSRGKTSFALQAATCAAKQNQTPIVWTMEMPPRAQFKRMVNQLSGVNVAFRELTDAQRQLQQLAVVTLNDKPVYFDRHSRSVASFVSSIRQVRAKADINFAIVDYLQLIGRSGTGRNRAQEVSENSRALKLAAMDLDIPILVLSQVDRGSVKGDDAKIGLHSAKESGDIENDADVVLWIEAPAFSRDQDTVASVWVGKQREGPTGFSIPMVFRPTTQTFMEMSRDGR